MKTLELSVCIVNWNTHDLLRACLRSLEQFPASSGQEVIVVDNASRDDSAAMVKAEFPDVKLIETRRNAGYAEGNNVAMQAASGEFLLLLNPDTEAVEGSLDIALAYLKAHPEVGALGVKLIHPDGRVQKSVRSFPSPGAIAAEYLGLSRLFPQSRAFGAYRMTWLDYEQEAEVDQPMGTFLLIPRAVYQKIGGMDERFPIFFNEVDWCFRAKRAGYKIVYLPDAKIIHHGGESTKQVKKAMIWESHRSLLRFYQKHYAFIWRALLSPLVYLNAFVRAKGWHKGFEGK